MSDNVIDEEPKEEPGLLRPEFMSQAHDIGYQLGLLVGRRQGYRAAAYDFGTWKDGSVRIGCMGRSIDEVMARYDEPGFTPTQGWSA